MCCSIHNVVKTYCNIIISYLIFNMITFRIHQQYVFCKFAKCIVYPEHVSLFYAFFTLKLLVLESMHKGHTVSQGSIYEQNWFLNYFPRDKYSLQNTMNALTACHRPLMNRLRAAEFPPRQMTSAGVLKVLHEGKVNTIPQPRISLDLQFNQLFPIKATCVCLLAARIQVADYITFMISHPKCLDSTSAGTYSFVTLHFHKMKSCGFWQRMGLLVDELQEQL